MNIKKSLENRIKGWLPKEPTPHSIKSTMGRRSLVNRRVLILLSVSLICLVLFIGGVFIFLSWLSEQTLENLKSYSTRLEDDGFTVEPKPLTEFHVDTEQEWYWYSDFKSYAKQEKVTIVHYDQSIKGLYFLTRVSPTDDRVVAIIFYYNKISYSDAMV